MLGPAAQPPEESLAGVGGPPETQGLGDGGEGATLLPQRQRVRVPAAPGRRPKTPVALLGWL